MQDYSRLQYLILKQMFSCRMTILGDRAQTMADEKQDSHYVSAKDFREGYSPHRP